MQELPGRLAEHLQGDVTQLTICWVIKQQSGVEIRGTAHDADIVISAGRFAGVYKTRSATFATDVRSSADGAVTNSTVEGAVRVDASVDEIRIEDIEGGLYDQAEAQLFVLNWGDPDGGERILVSGTLGEFFRDSDGRYRSEVRGLTQALAQQIVLSYSEMCNVEVFGDTRCKFDVATVSRTGTVTAVTSRRRFDVQLDTGPVPASPVYFTGGRLLFTSGDNSGFVREVRVAAVNTADDTAQALLWDEVPYDIQIGDTFSLPPGCDRQESTCRLVHNNLANFRGYGVFATGRDALMRSPTDSTSASAQPSWEVVTQTELDAKLTELAAKLAALL